MPAIQAIAPSPLSSPPPPPPAATIKNFFFLLLGKNFNYEAAKLMSKVDKKNFLGKSFTFLHRKERKIGLTMPLLVPELPCLLEKNYL